MDKLRKTNGITIIEILIASLLASVVFLAVASSYTSGLRLLASTQDSKSLDPAMAMNLMSKNTVLANQITLQSAGPTTGSQLTLTLDYTLNANGVPDTPNYTSTSNDDSTIVYKFTGSPLKLWTNYRNWGVVASADKEVIPGLAVTAGSFSLFNPVNSASNAVTISIQSGGKTLNTTVAAWAATKSLA